MNKENPSNPEIDTFPSTDLTANMEDYIETIALIFETNRVVRVKDIARSMGITMPSVTAALNKLKEKKLIHYEKYGYIELTPRGKKVAATVYSKHQFLKKFFHDVLRMNTSTAEEEACRIEHHLSPQACSQLNRLLEFHLRSDKNNEDWVGRLRKTMELKPLSSLREGDSAFIERIDSESTIKKRLTEMGFRKGELISIVRYAPLRDPMEISIKGYNLSLRVAEARDITVRPVDPEEGGNA